MASCPGATRERILAPVAAHAHVHNRGCHRKAQQAPDHCVTHASHLQRRHHRSSPTMRQANTAWSGHMCWPVTSRPRSSRARERAQVSDQRQYWACRGLMDGGGNSIIERPRPLTQPRHAQPHPPHLHLKCKEPVFTRPREVLHPLRRDAPVTSRCTCVTSRCTPIRRGRGRFIDWVHRLQQQASTQPQVFSPRRTQAASDVQPHNPEIPARLRTRAALHPICRGAPDQKGCNAYGSGAPPHRQQASSRINLPAPAAPTSNRPIACAWRCTT